MSGHKILIELEPEVEQRLREIAARNGASISTTASRIVNNHIKLTMEFQHFRALNQQGDK